jgi:hypothetical protein
MVVRRPETAPQLSWTRRNRAQGSCGPGRQTRRCLRRRLPTWLPHRGNCPAPRDARSQELETTSLTRKHRPARFRYGRRSGRNATERPTRPCCGWLRSHPGTRIPGASRRNRPDLCWHRRGRLGPPGPLAARGSSRRREAVGRWMSADLIRGSCAPRLSKEAQQRVRDGVGLLLGLEVATMRDRPTAHVRGERGQAGRDIGDRALVRAQP